MKKTFVIDIKESKESEFEKTLRYYGFDNVDIDKIIKYDYNDTDFKLKMKKEGFTDRDIKDILLCVDEVNESKVGGALKKAGVNNVTRDMLYYIRKLTLLTRKLSGMNLLEAEELREREDFEDIIDNISRIQ